MESFSHSALTVAVQYCFIVVHLFVLSKCFLRRYESCIMPADNKPLEMSVLKRVKELLAEVDARTAAKHITLVDCTVRQRTHGCIVREPPFTRLRSKHMHNIEDLSSGFFLSLLGRLQEYWVSTQRCKG